MCSSRTKFTFSGKVKAKVDGKIQVLLAEDENMTVSIATNVAQLALSALQMKSSFDVATPFWKYCSSIAFFGQFSIISALCYTKIMTRDTIEKCRKFYEEIIIKEKELVLSVLQRRYDEIRLWQINAQMEMRENELDALPLD